MLQGAIQKIKVARFLQTTVYGVEYASCFSGQFLRVTAECFARLSHRLGVCPSVCLSHS